MKEDRSNLDDWTLVSRAVECEEWAYGELVLRYRRAAFALALPVTGKAEDAEDAAQESFVVALERLEECRDRSSSGTTPFLPRLRDGESEIDLVPGIANHRRCSLARNREVT